MVLPRRIILVHGTFAFDEFDDVPHTQADSTDVAEDRSPKWWQQGSEFANKLKDGLGADRLTTPVKQPYSALDDLRPRWNRWFG